MDVIGKLVVLDTNVLLDLYVYQDPRTLPLKNAIEGDQLDLFTCTQAMAELADVLARDKFKLAPDRQQDILKDWSQRSRLIADAEIARAPWRCKDRADQVFLDMAWTYRPCVLLSKDLQVLKFAKRAAKEGVRIASAFHEELLSAYSL